MTTFQKLKHEARRAEQRSDWARAIDLYQRALDTDEDMADLSLYNRIGDLHLRLGQNDAAVECYERAVERYADNGMHTSAIALCNKILRIAPGRLSIYRRLAGLHARTGLVVEGRSSLLNFVDGALEEGRTEEARQAVEAFAEQTGDEEVRLQLADRLLKREEPAGALEQLRAVYHLRNRRGADTSELRRRIEELAPEADGLDESESAGVSEAGGGGAPVRLAGLVAGRLAADGGGAAFDPEATRPSGEIASPSDDRLDGVRRELGRFRRNVQYVIENSDPTVRYDLGVEFMTVGLLDEAIEEFQAAVADPRLLEAANARIGECLALRSSGSSFEAIRAASRRTGHSPGARTDERPAAAEEEMPGEGGEPATLEAPPSDPESSAAPPESAAPPLEEPAEPDDEEDELQGHFFRARLAQYRIRRAEERHMTDHAAHLDLGTAYVEMDLHQEALRELGVALSGPRPVSGRAARTLSKLALGPDVPPELALEIVERLSAAGAVSAAEALGTRLSGAWGSDHPMIDELVDLRSRLWGAADDLPALEDMFPALGEAVPAREEVSPRAEEDEEAPAPTERPARPEPGDAEEGEIAAEAHPVDAEVAEEPGDEAEAIRTGDGAQDADTATGEDPVERALARADELLAAGDEDSAAERLHRTFLRLEEEHRTREALAVLDRLLDLQPDDATLHHHRTELAVMVNDRERLLGAHAGLAACLRRLGSAARARAAYGRMLDIDPSNETARRAIAEIDAAELEEERHRGGDRPQAEKAARTAPEAGPLSEEEAAELDALIEGLEGDEDLEVLPADPDEEGEEPEDVTARSRYELGLAFRQMGMWEEAVRELRPALHGVTDRLGVLEALGESLLKSGRPEEAVDLLRSNLRADEDGGQVGPLYFLGLALQAEGEAEAAREVLGRVEAAQPGYRDTAERLSELSL